MDSEMGLFFKKALEDESNQADFYEHFLNSLVYIPTWNKPAEGVVNAAEGVEISPVLLEDNDIRFIMMFDTEERLNAWAEEGIFFVAMPGAMVLQTFGNQFHLLLNLGEESNKVFKPEEIEWLLENISPAGQA